MCLLWAALLIPSLHAELPDPGGVFAGTFRSAIAPLTFAALANGFLQVPDSVRARLDKLERVELCVFLAAELEAFQKAHHDILASQPDSSLMMRHQTGRFSHVITMINMVSNRINSAARQLAEAELLLSLKSTGTEALLPLGARVPWLLIRIATPRMRLRASLLLGSSGMAAFAFGQPVTQLLNHHLSTHTTRQQMQAMATATSGNANHALVLF
eukprot:g52667.t1